MPPSEDCREQRPVQNHLAKGPRPGQGLESRRRAPVRRGHGRAHLAQDHPASRSKRCNIVTICVANAAKTGITEITPVKVGFALSTLVPEGGEFLVGFPVLLAGPLYHPQQKHGPAALSCFFRPPFS